MEGTYLLNKEYIYDKRASNIIINGDKLEAILSKSGMRQGCPLILPPFQYSGGSTSQRNKAREGSDTNKKRSQNPYLQSIYCI